MIVMMTTTIILRKFGGSVFRVDPGPLDDDVLLDYYETANIMWTMLMKIMTMNRLIMMVTMM